MTTLDNYFPNQDSSKKKMKLQINGDAVFIKQYYLLQKKKFKWFPHLVSMPTTSRLRCGPIQKAFAPKNYWFLAKEHRLSVQLVQLAMLVRTVYPVILSVHFIYFSTFLIFRCWVALSKWNGYFLYLAFQRY